MEKKNGAIHCWRAATSQPPSTNTSTAIRSAIMVHVRARMPRRAICSSFASDVRSGWPLAAGPFIFKLPCLANFYFLAQVVPDLARNLNKTRFTADLGGHARARQIDFIHVLEGGRPGAQHEHTIRQRDGFFKVVRHEHDRARVARPSPQQFV